MTELFDGCAVFPRLLFQGFDGPKESKLVTGEPEYRILDTLLSVEEEADPDKAKPDESGEDGSDAGEEDEDPARCVETDVLESSADVPDTNLTGQKSGAGNGSGKPKSKTKAELKKIEEAKEQADKEAKR